MIVDSGASTHLMSKVDFSSEELETVKVSRHPTTLAILLKQKQLEVKRGVSRKIRKKEVKHIKRFTSQE